MICKWCNKENPSNNQFCMHCGQKLIERDNNNYTAYQNPNNYNNFQNNQTNNNFFQPKEEVKKANIGLAILSWLIPLAGLIIFIVKKEKDPKTAKVSGICALISFLLGIVTTILLFSITSYIINKSHNNINNSINNLWGNVENNTINDNDIYNNNIQEETDNNLNNEDSTNTSNNWKEYKVTVNGKTLTLPTTFNELDNAVTFNMKSADTKSYLQNGYYTLLNLYKNDKLALYIEVLNDTEEDQLYKDCKITRISQTKYQVSQGADTIIFPGNLKVGEKLTKAEVIELFGEPDDSNEYNNDNYHKITYKYFENNTWTTTNNYEITVINGIIEQLQLDNRR